MTRTRPFHGRGARAARQAFAAAVLCLGAACMSGCAQLPAPPVDGSDLSLQTSLQERLADDELVADQGVIVRVNNGVVTLIGGIEDPGVRARAAAIVKGAPGVRQVIDRLGP